MVNYIKPFFKYKYAYSRYVVIKFWKLTIDLIKRLGLFFDHIKTFLKFYAENDYLVIILPKYN